MVVQPKDTDLKRSTPLQNPFGNAIIIIQESQWSIHRPTTLGKMRDTDH